jgi:hypothetical protein
MTDPRPTGIVISVAMLTDPEDARRLAGNCEKLARQCREQGHDDCAQFFLGLRAALNFHADALWRWYMPSINPDPEPMGDDS